MMNDYLFGIHEPPPVTWLDDHMRFNGEAAGWIVYTHECGHDPSHHAGFDYRHVADRGFGVIARLNNAYSPSGTLPLDPADFGDFATRLAWWVANSEGCNHWIIGNEPNSSVEGMFHTEVYAACFRLCYDAIKQVQPDSVIMPAPVAMWNVETGDWLVYYRELLLACQPFDAICWHTYTHGSDPALITSMQTMDPPYEDRLFQFRAYWDLWDATPGQFFDRLIYITETDQGDVGGVRNPWLDDPGVYWIRSAYEEIDLFNRQHGYPIKCLVCYRWPQYDEWHIEGKPHVYHDFAAAVSFGFKNKEEEPMDWVEVYVNHCDEYRSWGEFPQVSVLEGYELGWVSSMARPEMGLKEVPQMEVYALDEPRSGVGFLPYAKFDWWIRTEQPVAVTPFRRTKLSVALMIVAHGVEGEATELGDCGMIVGIGGPDDDSVDSPGIVWGDWQTVRDPTQPGANMQERIWKVVETPEIVPSVGQVHIYIRCVANVAADISAGHWDLIRVLQMEEDVPPVTGNQYRIVVYDSQGQVVAETTFLAAGSNNLEICSLAQQIVSLSCSV